MSLFLINPQKLFPALVILFFSSVSTAQSADRRLQETISSINDSVKANGFYADIMKTKELKKVTFNLVPSSYILQYAGSIRLLSLGTGWDYGRQKQWSTDLLIGSVP